MTSIQDRFVGALMLKKPERIRERLAAGADPNAMIGNNTPLQLAILRRMEPAIILVLLQAGADPNAAVGNNTPLQLALLQGVEPAIFLMLLQAGANPNVMIGPDPDYVVPAIFKVVHQWGITMEEVTDTDEHERLRQADLVAYVDVVREMIARGVDPNITGEDGQNVFHEVAPYMDSPEAVPMIDTLIRAGVNPNMTDTLGMTALEKAIYYSVSAPMLGNIIGMGVDPNALNEAGTALLHRLVNQPFGGDGQESADVISHRVNNALGLPGINVNIQSSTEETPLHLAVKMNNIQVVQALLDAGADPNIRARGVLASDIATNPRVKALLQGEGDYAGRDKSDLSQFIDLLWNEPANMSMCPVCLAFMDRSAGCRYMAHKCKPGERDEELYNKYKGTSAPHIDKIEWCTECGRICDTHHRHYNLGPANLPAPGIAPVDPARDPAAAGGIVHFVSDCRPSGGGGLEEKFIRIQSFLRQLAELQPRIGKLDAGRARIALVRKTWNSPSLATPEQRAQFTALAELFRNPPGKGATEEQKAEWSARVQSLNDFGVNLDVFAGAVAGSATAIPNFPRPEADRDLLPIRHDAGGGPAAAGGGGDNYCISELGPHDDNRPTFQFQHRQPDGSVYTHPRDEFICGEHLMIAIDADRFTGKCPINPERCTADLHPDELDALGDQIPEDYRRNYRSKFNRLKAGDLLGGKRRKTYRKKKSGRRLTASNPNAKMMDAPDIVKSMVRRLGDDEYTCGVAF